MEAAVSRMEHYRGESPAGDSKLHVAEELRTFFERCLNEKAAMTRMRTTSMTPVLNLKINDGG